MAGVPAGHHPDRMKGHDGWQERVTLIGIL
jgi:hypothetical protein